jgi:FlaA1/EpsC-like NDP-sugar epimerase
LFLVLSVQHGKNEVLTGGNHISAEKLLGREPIRLPLDESFRDLQDKVILVTGGGGSIGSELCRQIARHHPKRLLLLDICENSAHAVRLELEDRYPDLDLVVLIGSVRDSRRLDAIFSRYRPDVVYHAAAHKHVPLMEENPAEAIKNNVLGTYKTAYAAVQNGCRRFVLISTDKAVHPVGVMGASKRLCEMVIQTFDQLCREGRADELPLLRLHDGDAPVRHPLSAHPRTEFVAVRFGNVLGSSGSVLGRFEEQIARGGPVTVTHPEVVRYFMTVSEAVSLVLQAGVYAQGGEIFVLDMGPPVKIDALARSLIRLSGYRPDADIPIVYTGLRPGEKLYEEKLMAEEGLKTTPNRKIHIAAPVPLETERLLRQLPVLMEAAYDERPELCDLLAELVPTYHPSAPAPPMRVVPGQAKTGVGEYAHERYRLSG